jgi:ABC-type antimicrobial peptide transport system permease subunit
MNRRLESDLAWAVPNTGIRLALGAARSSVRWLVMREALLLVSIGLAIAVPIALGSDRVISGMHFGLTPTDPLSIFAAVGLTLAVAALAGYIPARRATKVDPIVALRYE